jgi:hypothetical protein
MDLTLVIASLSKYKIYEYNSERPIVFVEAKDPDEACFKAVHNLLRMILKQDDTEEARLFCKEIKSDIRVIKATAE